MRAPIHLCSQTQVTVASLLFGIELKWRAVIDIGKANCHNNRMVPVNRVYLTGFPFKIQTTRTPWKRCVSTVEQKPIKVGVSPDTFDRVLIQNQQRGICAVFYLWGIAFSSLPTPRGRISEHA